MAKIHYEPPAYFYRNDHGGYTVAGWMPGTSLWMTKAQFDKWCDLGFPWFVYAYDWVAPTLNTKMIERWEREKSIPDQMARAEVLEPAGVC